jgi:hypothetical protein
MKCIKPASSAEVDFLTKPELKQIIQVHKKGKIVRFTQSNYSPLNKIWKLPTMCVVHPVQNMPGSRLGNTNI